jgi:hypothetical protein
MSHSWKSGVSGDWNDRHKWTNGVPTAGSSALITASGTYIVTSSSQGNNVETLEMSTGATLAINAHHIGITNGTGSGALAGTIEVASGGTLLLGEAGGNATYNNTGTIIVSGEGLFRIVDVVQLNGSGKIQFTGLGRLVGEGSGAQLTNENTISGPGVIGNASFGSAFKFINGSNGVINGDGTTNGPATTLLLDIGDVDQGQGATNNGLIQASGDSGSLSIIGHLTQGANGQLTAATSGAVVQLAGAKITGGTISTVTGATLLAEEGDNSITTPSPIVNAGTIEADGNLTITGSINNSGSLVVKGSLTVNGKVTGGNAQIYGSGTLEFGGASSTNVTFESGSSGMIVLNLPAGQKFTGVVAGMDVNEGASISLSHIPYADNPMLSFDSSTGVLTVTNAHAGKTVTINTVMTPGVEGAGEDGGFFITQGSDGNVLILGGAG